MNSDIAGRMTNVCISNVPGPQVPVYMNGAKLVSQMGMGPLGDRMGLFMAVTSQGGKMTFGATSCRRTLPDIDFFAQCLNDSFAELLAAAKALPPKPAAKSASNQNKKVAKKATPKQASEKASKKVAKKTTKKVTKKANKKAAKKTPTS